MPMLSSYSIESDSIVLLTFADGVTQRVRVSQLPNHLNEPDLFEVREALKLRRRFLQRYLPKLVVGLAVGAFTYLGGAHTVMQLRAHNQRHQIAVNTESPTASVAPLATPPLVSPSATPAVLGSATATATRILPSSAPPSPVVSSAPRPTPAPSVLQSVTKPVVTTVNNLIRSLPLVNN